MRFTISGKNLEVTDSMKKAVTEKLGKLERYFTPETPINVTMSVEKERQKIEVTIPVKGHTIRAEEASDDMYTSINEVEEVIERQLRRYRTRIIDKAQDGPKSADDVAYFSSEFMDSGEEAFEEEDADIVSGDIRITRTKHFGLKPMYPEDACIEMELLGHNFFVFRNAETDEVNVVYKRKKQNTYGLIEPEF